MRKNKFLPILRTIFLIVASVVLGINIYNWNAKSLTGNVLPMPFGHGAAVVLTGSMEPTIKTGDLILVKESDSFEVGDVVVYQSGRILVVHRIMEIDGETAILRGDANNADDAPIELSQIKGRVFGCIPYMGTVARILKTPWATALLIGGAVLMVELPYRKKKEEDQEELERIKEEIRRLKEEQ